MTTHPLPPGLKLVPDIPLSTHESDPVVPQVPDTPATSVDEALDRVFDPEIPVLTIRDLGILRGWTQQESGRVEVVITPTYSGCPAMQTITEDVLVQLRAAGFDDAVVRTDLTQAWTTDWMSQEGKDKLAAYGIAPPTRHVGTPVRVTLGLRPPGEQAEAVACPRCGSAGREVSRFGSTSCKAQYVCTQCAEPFDHFKSI